MFDALLVDFIIIISCINKALAQAADQQRDSTALGAKQTEQSQTEPKKANEKRQKPQT